MRLAILYRDEYLDLGDFNNKFGRLFYIKLFYYEDGKEVKIDPFPISFIETFEDLNYVEKNFQIHEVKVEAWMNWIQKTMIGCTGSDYDEEYYKERVKEDWDNNPDFQEEYPKFEDYFKYYVTTNSFCEMIGDEQRFQWDSIRYEHKEAFYFMDKEIDEFFDSYDNVNTRGMDNELSEAEEEVHNAIDNFKKNKVEFEEFIAEISSLDEVLSKDDMRIIITNIFEFE